MQKFAIFGIFAIGFNILFGLTGYLSFGHAAFFGVGSYTAVWSFKLLGMNADSRRDALRHMIVSALFAWLIGFISLRRTGIYFSILTLAFAQMSYNLAYSVLTPDHKRRNRPYVLTQDDPRVLDVAFGRRTGAIASLRLKMNRSLRHVQRRRQLNVGFYFCAVIRDHLFYISMRIFRSPFGMMLRAIKTNQTG